ncbi:MAG: Serine/threonine-protein kinase PknD [Mycoplasmataceae bacterium]|nr:Serine/threonine-protein kinase PknD [Mycoplasmataceae bacterium]WNE40368.1 MAG: Serine/threonine-protein kinase PknD [Mycoplasmataceae bacterium]
MSDNKNNFSGTFSNFTGGIGNQGQVTGQQTLNVHSSNSQVSSSSSQNSNKSTNSESSIQLTNKELGRGQFGKVYKGIWHGQTVAVKKIPAIYLQDIDKEIKVLKRLNHENIIKYHGEKSKDDNIFIIMELAENGSLNRWIERNKNQEHDWQTNYKFIDQITKGLIYLHGENIIHRDLKSSNILLDKDNRVKICDFGLAKIAENLSLLKTNTNNNPIGTVRWMAPENFKNGDSFVPRQSKYSDIYSLGMIMWEICAKNAFPFNHLKDDVAVMFGIGSGTLREEIPTETPAELAEIIELCWRFEPSERISLNDIEQELDNLIHEAVMEVI